MGVTGIAIGIGIYSSFNENSISALVTTGVLDAFSAGVLLYDGLVNIVRGEKFVKARNSHQYLQLASLWLGAFIMSLVGKWA
jgi:zinc transporter 1/2/3